MLNLDYKCLYFEDIIEKYAKSNEECVVFLRSYGWNNSTDVDKINESMEVYKQILPLDIFTALTQSEFVFVTLTDVQQAMDFFDDVLPENQESCEKEFYIHFSIYNSSGQIIANN